MATATGFRPRPNAANDGDKPVRMQSQDTTMKKALIGLVLSSGLMFGVDYGTHQVAKRRIVVLKDLVPNLRGVWVTMFDHGFIEGDRVLFHFRVTVLLYSGKYQTLSRKLEFSHIYPMTVWFPINDVERVVSVNIREEQDHTIE